MSHFPCGVLYVSSTLHFFVIDFYSYICFILFYMVSVKMIYVSRCFKLQYIIFISISFNFPAIPSTPSFFLCLPWWLSLNTVIRHHLYSAFTYIYLFFSDWERPQWVFMCLLVSFKQRSLHFFGKSFFNAIYLCAFICIYSYSQCIYFDRLVVMKGQWDCTPRV